MKSKEVAFPKTLHGAIKFFANGRSYAGNARWVAPQPLRKIMAMNAARTAKARLRRWA